MATFDLLVLGDAKPDLILEGAGDVSFGTTERVVDAALLTLGGSGAIAACGAAALGLRVAFAGAIGEDEFGAFVSGALAAHGVDTGGVRIHAGEPTGVSVVMKRATARPCSRRSGRWPRSDVPTSTSTC